MKKKKKVVSNITLPESGEGKSSKWTSKFIYLGEGGCTRKMDVFACGRGVYLCGRHKCMLRKSENVSIGHQYSTTLLLCVYVTIPYLFTFNVRFTLSIWTGDVDLWTDVIVPLKCEK